MRILLLWLLLLLQVGAFELVKVKEIKLKKELDLFGSFSLRGEDGFTIIPTRRAIVAISIDGRILWSIYKVGSFRIIGDSVFVRRGNYLFEYDLVSGDQKNIFIVRNLPSMLFSRAKFLRRNYFFAYKTEFSKKLDGAVIRRKQLLLFVGKGKKLKLKLVKDFPVTPFEVLPTDEGILIFGYAPHNYVIKRGIGDFYAGLYLIGITGRIIASYRLYGRYVRPSLLLAEGDRVWVLYTESYVPYDFQRKAGVMIFDLHKWKAVKEIKLDNSVIYLGDISKRLLQIKEGEVAFPLFLGNGKFLLLDRDLKVRSSFYFENVQRYWRYTSAYSRVEVGIDYFLVKGGYLFLLYSIQEFPVDPRHGGTRKIYGRYFKVFSLKGKLLYHKKFGNDFSPIVPVVDLKRKLVSFHKGDSIDVYKIID